MKFNKEEKLFIEGVKFSDSHKFNIKDNFISSDRLDYLEYLCKNEKVLHIGCVDHIELIEEKIKQNKWLHKRLDKVTDSLIGIDINKKGVDYLTKELGYKNVFYGDMINDKNIEEIKEKEFKYAILGEILEHVNNPVKFLTAITNGYKQNIKEVVITVPNAFSLSNTSFSKRGIECINTDHKYWFTPFTIAKVLNESGLYMKEIIYTNPSLTLFEKIIRKITGKLICKRPWRARTLVVIARFKDNNI